MKKVLLIAALLVAGFAAQAQVRSNAVKLNPLSLVLSTFNVSYEHAIGATKSVQLGVFYTGVDLSSVKYSGIGITPEIRFYLSDDVIDGFYIAPFVRYQNIKISEEIDMDESENAFKSNIFGGGALIGRQWMLGSSDRITLDIFFGPSYSAANIKAEQDGEDVPELNGAFDGFGLRTGVTIGVAF